MKFDYQPPAGDLRPESCHVFEDRMEVDGALDGKERPALLDPLILSSTEEAAARGLSLTLIRPTNSRFKYRRKSREIIAAEREAYMRASRQMSMFDKELEAFEPTPYAFAFSYDDAAGRHSMQCGDWETSAAFWRFRKLHDEKAALDHLSTTYNETYPSKGMVFAMGTVKKRPKQWILLGVIRLDDVAQRSLLF